MDVIRKRHRDMLERPQADAPVYRAILWVVLIRATPLLCRVDRFLPIVILFGK